MIDLYISIQSKLAEVEDLKYIDMVDDEHPDTADQESSEPTALIKMPPIDWKQQGENTLYADLNFTIKLTGKPFYSGESKSPVLTELKDSLAWMYDAKDKLYQDDVEYISNINLIREHFSKKGRLYELELQFTGFVEYEME